jgi:hypothetical protein
VNLILAFLEAVVVQFVLVVELILFKTVCLRAIEQVVGMMYIMDLMHQHLQHFQVVVLIRHLKGLDLAQVLHIGLLISQIVITEHDMFQLIQEMMLVDVGWN